MAKQKKFSAYRNLETDERAPPHRIGTTEDGRLLYSAQEGWEPVEPYECDEDGNWIPAEPLEINAKHAGADCCITISDDSVDLEISLYEATEAVLTFEEFAALVKAIDKLPTKVRERILRC